MALMAKVRTARREVNREIMEVWQNMLVGSLGTGH